MRIISGKYKGRRISPPTNITARPTTDFAKESLFNLLANRIDFEDIDMLDLFAGTGGIGLEFVSRGAREVTAVEKAHTQQNFIISICKTLGIQNLNVVRGDVFRYMNTCRLRFDFIFADPPYALDTLSTIPDIIFEKELLQKGGWFVLEHSDKNDFGTHPHFVEHRQYGSVNFSFFQ
ncbi:MAG: 16S rRNA (guanine(966)-N(2))-methyltransferase RsmD [Paludibacter sp.]|nr:16S rRNA (guanine(966)-N(2))-methyltransferase RsmD [Bacteroidales bacterium]MCM1068789.1 16S rRNA (guanine(966)-N(2))-methyltransferase RsmD [Prevotella sp.]MCM1353930.1 16S rRNA (guanine(966)-N(2))-methyltransferase RsmD [Bacteroides sp.]MCM1443328.1 16S rRNA (guanine(966)-N(2))-methyltransferase RsmD [Muribaculum sp.]MCM1482131.1 16S rRNA (guanine(966)-N(2))-methyltransferase RsmD [Paludibacter sp.]